MVVVVRLNPSIPSTAACQAPLIIETKTMKTKKHNMWNKYIIILYTTVLFKIIKKTFLVYPFINTVVLQHIHIIECIRSPFSLSPHSANNISYASCTFSNSTFAILFSISFSAFGAAAAVEDDPFICFKYILYLL